MNSSNLATASDPASGARPEGERPPRILVVDDVADNRDILVRRLARRGFEVAEASGGEEAIARIESEPFDIVLLDIMMPDVSGEDVLRRVRETKSDIELPIIMVSAKSQSEDVVQSLTTGANDYVTKPIDFGIALARISAQLNRKRAGDAERTAKQLLEKEAEQLQEAFHQEAAQRQESESRLSYLAYHDALTGLLNRVAFRDVLNEALDNVAVSDEPPALLFIDLDRFKIVNDMHGHEVGDRLLRAVGDRLHDTVPPGAYVARLGGDEFGVIITNGTDAEHALSEANKLVRQLSEPFVVDAREFRIGASCGVARASDSNSDLDSLINGADLAMYHAKSSGRGGAVLFEPRMLDAQKERRALEDELRLAVQRGDFEVFYQPQVDVETGKVISFEALLRWPHPIRGMIAPDTFIPIAEDTGLIVSIGEWVLRTACTEAARWPGEIGVAVNMSPLQFRSPSLVPMVVNALAASGLPPERLEIEITESALLGADDRNHTILRSLRNLGVRISIDDFGTGYSSMTYLQNFAVDRIKIDKRFVQAMGTSAQSAAIVQAIISLGSTIGVKTTAEGVETTTQLSSVMEQGCTQVQGYLFSRPLRAEDARQLAQAGKIEGPEQ
jgi:diguanylate cyclase (GGDEF)-like protein